MAVNPRVSSGSVDYLISTAAGSANDLSLNADGSATNPAAFQQHFRLNSNVFNQIFVFDAELERVIRGNDLNKMQELLRLRHRQKDDRPFPFEDPIQLDLKIGAAFSQKGASQTWKAPLEHNAEGFARVKENVLQVGGGEVSVPFLQEKDTPSRT